MMHGIPHSGGTRVRVTTREIIQGARARVKLKEKEVTSTAEARASATAKGLQYFNIKFRLGIVCLITCPAVIFYYFFR